MLPELAIGVDLVPMSSERAIVALGRLGEDVPQIAEIDLNPVLVGTAGCAFVDVKVRLAAAVGLDAGIPRRLGHPR